MSNENVNNKYVWTAIWIIISFLLGFVILFIYGIGSKFSIGSALIWATAYFFCGCLVGFIFGVPKVVSNQTTPVGGTQLSDSQQRKAIQENNNLTDISDWLTKILVGAGLVQLQSIPPFVMKVAKRMGEGLALEQSFLHAATILSAGILLYYTSFGFISGYLTMRLVIFDFLTISEKKDDNNKINAPNDNN